VGRQVPLPARLDAAVFQAGTGMCPTTCGATVRRPSLADWPTQYTDHTEGDGDGMHPWRRDRHDPAGWIWL